MEMTQKVHDHDHHLFGWLTPERRNWIGTALLCGGIGFAWGQVSLNREFVDQKVAPITAQRDKAQKETHAAVASLRCERLRASVATASAYGALDPDSIPKCPPEPPAAAAPSPRP